MAIQELKLDDIRIQPGLIEALAALTPVMPPIDKGLTNDQIAGKVYYREGFLHAVRVLTQSWNQQNPNHKLELPR